MTDGAPYPLPEGFLHWLSKYLGDWSDGESSFQIYRRSDGWIQAHRFGGTEKPGSVPVGLVLREAKKIREPESPLGPYPIILSQEMMLTWLTPEEFDRLRGGVHVSVGRKMILECIHQRIRITPRDTVRARLAEGWARGASRQEGIPESEESIVLELLRQYQTELPASND
jgi:hypothetical protein